MASTTLPVLANDSGLSRYLNDIKVFPLLAKEERQELDSAAEDKTKRGRSRPPMIEKTYRFDS